jgi:hypothetical protein
MFALLGSQYKVQVGEREFYIDLTPASLPGGPELKIGVVDDPLPFNVKLFSSFRTP